MSLTTIVFFIIFTICLFGSVLYHPVIGVIGYIITYILSPASQWWGESLTINYGFRYSLVMAIAIAAGILFQQNKLNTKMALRSQEVFFLLLIAWTWLSRYIGLPPDFFPENFALKLFKVWIFILMFVRVVSTVKQYELVLWTIILTTTYLGYEAFFTSTATFGRLDTGVGGSDFSEGNFLAAHFAMILPFLLVLFIKGVTKHKLLLSACAVLIINGFILCRSRGALLALGMGSLSAIAFAPRKWKIRITVLILLAFVSSLALLVDKGFITRMQNIQFDVSNVEKLDSSASRRILAWQASIKMAMDHPLGIGQDNFSKYVGDYNPSIARMDTHSTYLRTFAELGFPGLLLLLVMLFNAFRILRKQFKLIGDLPLKKELNFHLFGQVVSLTIFCSAGLFITQTYIEGFYWLLFFPIILENITEHEISKELLAVEESS